MNILLLNPRYFPATGGIETYFKELSRELIDKGHKVQIICSKHTRNLNEFEIIEGVEVFRYPYVKGAFLFPKVINSVVKNFYNKIKGKVNPPDLIITRNSQLGFIFDRFYDCRKIYVVPSILKELKEKQRASYPFPLNIIDKYHTYPLEEKYERYALENYNIVVFSELMANKLKKVVNRNIKIIRPGVRFSESKMKKKDLGFEEDDFIVLAVGRLSFVKNYDLLINSFMHIDEKNIKCVIVGDGIEKSHLESLIQNSNLSDQVYLAGSKENPSDYYSNSDIFVISSYSESFGHVGLEAMAYGLPIISVDNKNIGVNEILTSGKNGFFIENDPANLSLCIKYAYNNKKFLEGIKKNNLMTIKCYTWDRHADELLYL